MAQRTSAEPALNADAEALGAVSVSVSVPHDSQGAVEMVVDGDTDGDAHGDTMGATNARAAPRAVRGRYAKFTAGMDVIMLEALRTHNPFTAKHGTRLEMWRLIAEAVGDETLKDPDAYSWHTCRDRVTTLVNLYADGKHDKLFKHGTVEENTRKEAILKELHELLHRKGAKPGSHVRAPTLLEARLTSLPSAETMGSSINTVGDAATPSGGMRESRQGLGRAGSGAQKRRRVDANGGGGGGRHAIDHAAIETENFRARVLELMETKIQFDMEQRAKENDLREHEFELQKRFLEYLQSK